MSNPTTAAKVTFETNANESQPGAGGYLTKRVFIDGAFIGQIVCHDADGTDEGIYYTAETILAYGRAVRLDGDFDTAAAAVAALRAS